MSAAFSLRRKALDQIPDAFPQHGLALLEVDADIELRLGDAAPDDVVPWR